MLYSVADTGGTPGTVPTAVPLDSNDPAATATLAYYTANPTAGTLVGVLGTKQTFYGNLTTGQPGGPACWDFNTRWGEQGVTLRGAAYQLAVNFNGETQSGNVVDIEIGWTEE